MAMMYVYIIMHVEGFGCLGLLGFLWRALLVMYISTQGMYSTNVYSELLLILPHSVHHSSLWTHISVQEWVIGVPSNNYVDNMPKLLFCYTFGRLIKIYCMNIHIYCS